MKDRHLRGERDTPEEFQGLIDEALIQEFTAAI
jgi:hypothetical protein